MAALSAAPLKAPKAKTMRGDRRSAMLNKALATAPATNPSCTDMVSHAAWPLDTCQ